MRYLKQFTVIAAVSLAGELLHHFIPLPVPASIYGMVLLFVLLETGVLKLSAIKETAQFLLEIMPIMFVPAAVGILESWDIIRSSVISYLITVVLVTVIVMAAAGSVTQLISRRKKKIAADIKMVPDYAQNEKQNEIQNGTRNGKGGGRS